jgi:hypothetical protein
MNRSLLAATFCASLLLAACGKDPGPKGDPGPQGPAGPKVPRVSKAFPGLRDLPAHKGHRDRKAPQGLKESRDKLDKRCARCRQTVRLAAMALKPLCQCFVRRAAPPMVRNAAPHRRSVSA